jgi:hypothetical protein
MVDTVARLRLVLLVTIAALVAPSVAPCLMTAAGGHAAMPCCHSTGETTPAARPCCLLDGGQPATPVAGPVFVPAAATTAAVLPVPAALTPPARLHLSSTISPPPSRRLSTILLI